MQSPVCLPQAYEVREVLSPLVIINETAGSENPVVLATVITADNHKQGLLVAVGAFRCY